MTRLFFCRVIGTGVGDLDDGDPFRPAISNYTNNWRIFHDGGATEMFAEADVTPEQYAQALQDPDIVEILPAERPPLRSPEYLDSLRTPLNQFPVEVLQHAKSVLEQRGIPTEGIELTDSVASVMRKIYRRYEARKKLRDLDFLVNMDLLLSSIPAGRRREIADRLTEAGFDPSVLTGDMTVRQALKALTDQRFTRGQVMRFLRIKVLEGR